MAFIADLHIHSCLSPCGDLESSPRNIAARAAELGIRLAALTDHNSALNCPAFADCCRRAGIVPLFGTETTSAEEVHVLSLFGDVDAALEWSALLYAALPNIVNRPELFGDQVVVDAEETILEFVEKHLVPAVSLTLDQIARETHARGGLCIPAHVDRTVNSVWSQLGFLPDTPFDALECTVADLPFDGRGLPRTASSDAHFIDDIGRRWCAVDADRPSFQALRDAIARCAVTPRFDPLRA